VNRSTRLAASLGEQAIRSGSCVLSAFYPELTTVGLITIRDEAGAIKVSTVTGIANTPFTSGGSLPDTTYFSNVLAVDINGELSGEGTEPAGAVVVAGGGNGRVVITWNADPKAYSYRVYVGLATGVYDGYFVVPAGTLTYNYTTNTGRTAGDTPAGIPTTGNFGIKHRCAAGLLQAGKSFGPDGAGVFFRKGLTVELANTADLSAVIWEAIP
jgi:hypothetical protein